MKSKTDSKLAKEVVLAFVDALNLKLPVNI